jgi:hypothetical protein
MFSWKALSMTDKGKAPENTDIFATLERMKETAQQREATEIIQLPFWPEPKRGTPNSLIRSALFSAVQGKDRQFMKEATLYSQQGITVKFTGEQLNQEDLSLWENLVHLAKEHPLGNVCTFTAYGILKSLGLSTGGKNHKDRSYALTTGRNYGFRCAIVGMKVPINAAITSLNKGSM